MASVWLLARFETQEGSDCAKHLGVYGTKEMAEEAGEAAKAEKLASLDVNDAALKLDFDSGKVFHLVEELEYHT